MKFREKFRISLLYTGFLAFFLGISNISVSQIDTEFWFVVPELSNRGNTGGTPGTLRIATLELPATVTISMPANPYHATLNPLGFQDIVVDIPANSATAVDLTSLIDVAANPTNNRLENRPLTPDGINNFGLHITATNMITVYWEVNYEFGSDLWTLKGRNALGTQFFTPFQTFYANRNFIPRTYSAIDIVATSDNTQITITLPPGKAASYGSLSTGIPAGGTYVLTLNSGQTFSLYPLNYSINAADRLAGTLVQSTEPIAISVKDDALAIGPQGQDVIGDQIVPVNIVGNHYIVPDMGNPNHVYVLATQDNTNIYVYDGAGVAIGPTPYVTLNRGQQALVTVPGGSKFAHITSSLNPADPVKPFYVFQLGVENQQRGGALVPAIGCTGNTQLAFTRARAGENKFQFFIIVKKGNEDKFLVDGVRNDGVIDPGAFQEIPGTGGYMAYFPAGALPSSALSVGQHLVENTGDIFHLGIFNGNPGAGQAGLYYGYYSDFGGLNIGANVAGTNSMVVRACYGDSVQLYAYGGTNYLWTPDTYLDDATSNLPTAINLPPGPHNYTVDISGACNRGLIDLTILVSTPVKAFFQTNVSSGCSPLVLNLEDQSSGVYSWQYDIGDTLIRYDLNPATPYPQPPGYPLSFSIPYTYRNTTNAPITDTVTLLVKNESGCSDIFTKTIVIFPEIYSDFTIPPGMDIGCDPLAVQFQNTSAGDTALWVWEFGDGGSSIESGPLHVFRNLFGPDNLVFETRLIAISPNFCRDTSSHLVTVKPYIEANFVYDTVFACTPHEIIITNQSFGADIYYWDFGDGTTSTSPGPQISKTFSNTTGAPVTYTIRLRVENTEGCFDEITRDVLVFPQTIASFTPSRVEGCSPFEVSFSNSSSGAAFYYWDFGDGSTSTEVSPLHLYERNMMDHDTTYTVTLISISSEYCRDTMRFNILVHPYIEAAFAVNDIVGCHPFNITITNQSTGVSQYFWDFGDGAPVSNTSAATFDYLYLNPGSSTINYPLQLIVLNDEGCRDTLSTAITVHPEITANFSASALEGCNPLSVTFTDLSVNAINYYWDFGDGASSVDHSPVHTFTNYTNSDTTFLVTLTTSTADGVCVKSISWPILVHPQAVAGFAFPEVLSCNPFPVTFENTSAGGITYYWDFGDGTDTITTDLNPVSHTFINNDLVNLRNFTITLIAENASGCSDTIRKSLGVYPAIQTSFSVSDNEGCHPFTVDFTNLTGGGQTFNWDFGDGTSSSLLNPSHIFINTGTTDSVYTVTLTAISPGHECIDSYSLQITVHPFIDAGFTIPDQLGCNPFNTVLYNSSVNATIFRWDFGDGTDTVTFNPDPVVHRFVNTDFINRRDYIITLIAENPAGCTDEIRRTITVEPDISAGFIADQVTGCNPMTVNFTGTSGGAAYFNWDFGNGSSSQLPSPVQTFTNPGTTDTTYHVRLYTTAANHICNDSSAVDIVVHPYLKAGFTFQENIDCSPFTVQFNNSSSGGQSFLWNFGDGTDTVTTDMNPVTHIFSNSSLTDTAQLLVTLTASNTAGCQDIISNNIEVYPDISASFTMDFNEGCHPLDVNFSNTSGGGFTFVWNFGDGSSSNAVSPTHTYNNFTDTVVTRQVRLTAVSRSNCTSEIVRDIIIHPGPKARFETDEVIACPPFDVLITNTSLNADQYTWYFGDGTTLNTASQAPVNHIYYNVTQNIQLNNLRLIARSAYGCVDSSRQVISVYPRTVADFSVNDEGCHPLTGYFTNLSVLGESYLWDFGDGTSITVKDPTHAFFNFSDQDTSYLVTLTSTSRYGCTDSRTDTINVYPQPTAEFIAVPTHQVFPSSTVTLTNATNTGPWTYTWDMDDGSTLSGRDPLPHSYSTWGEYDIMLYVSSSHCLDSVSHIVRIFPSAPVAGYDSIAPGCEALTVTFRNTSLYGSSYLWEFDDGSTSTEFEPTHTFTEDGIYNVKLTVNGDGGRDYAYRQVEVYPNPYVDFRITPELVMLPDQEVRLSNLSEDGVIYLWNFGDGNTSTEMNPEYLYSSTGIYDISLDVWTEHGCTGRLVKPQAVTVESKGLIVFPNAFEPDMSGPNDGFYSLSGPELNKVFHPQWEGVDRYRLEIYDRWGTFIYLSEDVMKGWDGYFQGKICKQDVYVYICTGTFINSVPFRLVGDVTLLYHLR